LGKTEPRPLTHAHSSVGRGHRSIFMRLGAPPAHARLSRKQPASLSIMNRAFSPSEMPRIVNSHHEPGPQAPKARTISAWGNAPGRNGREKGKRAVSPPHRSLVWISLMAPQRDRVPIRFCALVCATGAWRTVSSLPYGAGFQPLFVYRYKPWGFAPG
jgi:hypothetical protein